MFQSSGAALETPKSNKERASKQECFFNNSWLMSVSEGTVGKLAARILSFISFLHANLPVAFARNKGL